MHRTRLLFTCLTVGLFAAGASAQTTDELIGKHIEARGGYDRMKALETLKMTGTVSVQGMELPFTLYQMRPDRIRIESTMQGETFTQASDGETAWVVMPMMGTTNPQAMPADQARAFREQSDFDGLLVDYRDEGRTVELVGQDTLDGMPVYQLQVTSTDGDTTQVYLDGEEFLERRQTRLLETPQGKAEVVSVLSDYRPVAGVLMPHRITTRVNGMTYQEVRVETVQENPELDEALFRMPAGE